MTRVPWPTVATVQVELVPAERRHDELKNATWAVVLRLPDRTTQVFPPDDDEEQSLHPVEYGRLVAAATGSAFVEPPSWMWFARLNEVTWSCWDTRLCGVHSALDCTAASCADDDTTDVTVPPVPALILTTRPEVLAHAAH